MGKSNEFLVDVARLISSRDMTIYEFYEALGCDLSSHRIDADIQISELSGIFKGWETASNKGAD